MKDNKFTPELIEQIESMFAANFNEVLEKQSTIEPYLKRAIIAEYQRIDKLWSEFRGKTK
jgi:hypothetical protein